MSGSNATASSEVLPARYGSILSYVGNSTPPGIGTFLSQGVAAGAMVYFFFPLLMVLLYPSVGYNLWFVPFVACFVVLGMVLGIIEALIVWGCTKIDGDNFNPAIRAALPTGIAILIFAVIYYRNVASYPYYDRPVLSTDLLVAAAFLLPPLVIIGFVTGSRLRPWRALTSGSEVTRSRALAAATGVILRSLIVFGAMNAVIALVSTLKAEFRQSDLIFALISLVHFVTAAVIVFTRIRFWIVVQLALIINFPVVLLITEVLNNQPAGMRYAPVGYLAIWAAFLLARWRATYEALNCLKEEFRYYLID